jgi:Lrp/AsnC family transcriptional regulator for asnA, asnC and gidA
LGSDRASKIPGLNEFANSGTVTPAPVPNSQMARRKLTNSPSDGRQPTPPAVDKLDDIDKRVIAALQAEGRRPYSRIAADLNVSESVVRYRAQRLEQSGMLQVVGIADPLRIGFDHTALVGIKVRPGTTADVCEGAAALPETSYVVAIAGSYDVIAEVICRDTTHFTELLTERLHQIDGVVSTESFLVLSIHKMAYGWGVAEVAVAAGTHEQAEAT